VGSEYYFRAPLIGIFVLVLFTGISSAALSGHIVEAKKKSYQLIAYLDDAFKPNNLPSFKVVVYNSDHKNILSDKVTPDFTDDHQKISPRSGYKITDKSKQHPSQIDVCAQQTFTDNGKKKIHDDCFPIQQNKAKTYWYTIFNYPLIEGFEGGDDGGSPNCDSSYPDFCIPPPPPDLDCADINHKDFTVRSPDPHNLDGDNDGIGCES
jgi:hypothetical protein